MKLKTYLGTLKKSQQLHHATYKQYRQKLQAIAHFPLTQALPTLLQVHIKIQYPVSLPYESTFVLYI